MLSIRRSLFNVAKSYLNNKQVCLYSTTERLLSARKYTEKHEWISLQGDVGTVGISDYAQEKLGEVVYLELPKLGTKLTKGDVFATLESVKAVSECYSPSSGSVTEVNEGLSENPSLLNKSPHEEGKYNLNIFSIFIKNSYFLKGWLMKIKVDNAADVDSLMSEEKYQEYLKTHE